MVRHRAQSLEGMDDDALLALRFRELELPRGSGRVAEHMRHLHRELAGRGIRFRPHWWFSEEWFSPDGIPGIAVPYYLAQPRLMRLERRLMHQVEGGNSKWLMRILRHEAGHALDTAHGLRYSGVPASDIPTTTRLDRPAVATCCILVIGMPRAIPPRILPKPLRCGCSRGRAGGANMRAGLR